MAFARERDFFRWLKLPIRIYKAKIPMLDSMGNLINKEIHLVLPSDLLQALHSHGPDASCLGFRSDFFSFVFLCVQTWV